MADTTARGRRRLWGTMAAAALAVWLGWVWNVAEAQGSGRRLSLVITGSDGRLLVAAPVEAGQKVTLAYNHSVESVPVLEVFEVRGEGPLYLSELISRDPLLSYPGYERLRTQPWEGKSEGPLPADLDRSQRDWFVVRGFDRAQVMPLAVGSEFVDHRVLVGSRAIRLGEVARSGEIVKIFVEGR